MVRVYDFTLSPFQYDLRKKCIIKSKLNKYMAVRTYTNVTLNTNNFYIYEQTKTKTHLQTHDKNLHLLQTSRFLSFSKLKR